MEVFLCRKKPWSWWRLVTFFSCFQLFLLTVIGPNRLAWGLEENVSLPKSFIDEGEEERTTLAEDENEEQEIFCPGKMVDLYQATYGNFTLPRTAASVNGTQILSTCPHGAITVGAVLLNNSQIELKTSTTKQQESGGLTSFCYLNDDQQLQTHVHDYSPLGTWKHQPDDNLNKCREQITEDLKNSVQVLTTGAEIITKKNVKQAIPKLNSLLRYAYKDYGYAQTLLDGVSRLLEEIEIFQDPTVKVYRKALFDIIQGYAKNTVLMPGERISLVSNSIAVETVIFPEGTSGASDENEDEPIEQFNSYDFETMHLPPQVIQLAMEETNSKKLPRLELIAYSNQLFSHWGEEDDDFTNSTRNNTTTNFVEEATDFTGIWRILTVHTDAPLIQNLTEPIVYTLSVNQTLNDSLQWVCVYWDADKHKWVSTEMKSITFPNGTKIQCESRTMAPSSAFSVLLQPKPPKYEKPPKDDDGSKDWSGDDGQDNSSQQVDQTIHTHILSILSSVGSALSMTGLAITVLTYALFRCLRKERSNRILLNLSLSLFMLHLMSLISTKRLWDNECLVPAFLLHYLLLSSISWMLVEAVHMYRLLISVFVKPQSKFLLKRSLLAWGLPFLLVLICACVDPLVYKSGRGDWCIIGGHLNLTLYYICYLGPAALMLLINCFVFVRIVRVLVEQGANLRKQQSKTPEIKFNNDTVDWNKNPVKTTTSFINISPTQIKGAITVMVLLGVGWIFGFLAIGPFEIVFQYLFCLCNAGQGLFIFIFRVLLHPQACRAWRRAVMKGFSSDSDLSSFGLSSRKSQIFSSSSSITNTLTKSNPFSSGGASAGKSGAT